MKFLKGFARRFATAFSILSIILVGGTYAATQFLTGTVGDPSVGSIVLMFLNAAGNATPVSPSAPLPVALAAAPTGAYIYAHIAAGAAATHVVKASAGTLHTVCYNGAATATDVTTIYDNASGSGTVIAAPVVTGITVPICQVFDVAFANGLTVITATANGGDMTISYE